MKQKFDVTGMTCSACSSRVEKQVSALNGINQVSVNLLTNSMQVSFDENILATQDIISAVVNAGYSAAEHTNSAAASKPANDKTASVDVIEKQMLSFKKRLWVSFIFLIPLMYISMGHMWGMPIPSFLAGHGNAVSFGFTQFLLCLPIVAVNIKYFTNGFSALWHRSPNMDSLIAVGSSAALVYGVFAIYRMSYGLGAGDMAIVSSYHMDLYFESAATILALITLGKFLETKSKGKTSEALNKLINLAPKTAIVERDGQEFEIAAEDVVVGDIVIIKPGSSVPVDGIVVEGETSIDEASITGESIPVHKEKGMPVIGATINKTGYIKIKSTKVGENTTFAQIIKLVEEASSTKAPIAKLADKISGVFVPIVMVIALFTAIVWIMLGASFEFALSTAICVLVISCPCALGLATPVAIMVGTGKGAENGILIKSGEALETAHSIETVVFDKTGTITQGKPTVTDIIPYNCTKSELLQLAASLESKSEHPLADAIINYSKQQNVTLLSVQDFRSISGKGLSARIAESFYTAGNARLMQENSIDLSAQNEIIDTLAYNGKTPLIFAKENRVIGIIAVADVIKPSSKSAIKKLKSMGLEVIMLTGDNKKTAEGIGKDLQLTKIIAEVLPQDKEKVIFDLQAQGKKVAMVGDGINDAPALVRADVGIAIGSGTDIAIESADIILMQSDLLSVVTAIKLSKSVIKNIKENLFWAFFYNCLGIPLAAGVFFTAFGWKLSPMFGAAAMSFSSLFVVTNALRLKLFKAEKNEDITSKNTLDADIILENSQDIYIKQKTEQQKESDKMITLKIDGMMCGHCQKHVEDALNAINGVYAQVELDNKQAKVTAPPQVTVQELSDAVTAAGYTVVGIIE